jgi:hypothetical protein
MSAEIPVIRFFFDARDCFWAGNDSAFKKFGNPVVLNKLPLSKATIKELEDLIDWYFLIDNPQVPLRSQIELKNIDKKVEEILRKIEEETKDVLIVENEYNKLCKGNT